MSKITVLHAEKGPDTSKRLPIYEVFGVKDQDIVLAVENMVMRATDSRITRTLPRDVYTSYQEKLRALHKTLFDVQLNLKKQRFTGSADEQTPEVSPDTLLQTAQEVLEKLVAFASETDSDIVKSALGSLIQNITTLLLKPREWKNGAWVWTAENQWQEPHTQAAYKYYNNISANPRYEQDTPINLAEVPFGLQQAIEEKQRANRCSEIQQTTHDSVDTLGLDNSRQTA